MPVLRAVGRPTRSWQMPPLQRVVRKPLSSIHVSVSWLRKGRRTEWWRAMDRLTYSRLSSVQRRVPPPS